jgi:hypothetical protein
MFMNTIIRLLADGKMSYQEASQPILRGFSMCSTDEMNRY